MKKSLLTLTFLTLLLSGCSIQFTSNRVRDGGIFRSDDFGATWTHKVVLPQQKGKAKNISTYDVLSITPSPSNAQELTVTTAKNGIVRTKDGGETWAALANLSDGQFLTFSYDPVNESIQYTATNNVILKSVDSGAQWTAVYTDTTNANITALGVDRYDALRIYAATNVGTILKSVNGGTEWKTLTTVQDNVRQIIIRSDDTRIVYLATSNKGILRTTDGGVTWTDLAPQLKKFPHALVTNELLVQGSSPSTLFLASGYGLLKSTDGGDTWTEIKTLLPSGNANIRTVGVDPAGSNLLYFSVNNLVHKSDDSGATWQTVATIPTGRMLVRMIVHPTLPGVLFAGTFKTK